jgi:flagellar biosynthesis/type III secretory pathway protein FliH
MFEVIGDEIIFDKRTIGRFENNLSPSFRKHVENELTGIEYKTEKEIDEMINEAEEEASEISFGQGKSEGKQEARDELKKEIIEYIKDL